MRLEFVNGLMEVDALPYKVMAESGPGAGVTDDGVGWVV